MQWHKMFYDDCKDTVWISQKEFYYFSALPMLLHSRLAFDCKYTYMHTTRIAGKYMWNEKSARRHYELSANILQLKGLSGFRFVRLYTIYT